MAQETLETFVENFVETGKMSPPRHFGRRYDAAGNFLPERGNTVICRVVPGSQTLAALVSVREGLLGLPFADRFAFTPVSSLHMTVFQGVVENRRLPGFWPIDVPLDTEVAETTSLFSRRLADFPPPLPFRMKLASVTPLGLSLAGATPDDERAVRTLRNNLVTPFGYSHPDHHTYRFHITIAYIKRWLPAGSERVYVPALKEFCRQFRENVDIADLEPPALCTFRDMTEFTPVITLD